MRGTDQNLIHHIISVFICIGSRLDTNAYYQINIDLSDLPIINQEIWLIWFMIGLYTGTNLLVVDPM